MFNGFCCTYVKIVSYGMHNFFPHFDAFSGNDSQIPSSYIVYYQNATACYACIMNFPKTMASRGLFAF